MGGLALRSVPWRRDAGERKRIILERREPDPGNAADLGPLVRETDNPDDHSPPRGSDDLPALPHHEAPPRASWRRSVAHWPG